MQVTEIRMHSTTGQEDHESNVAPVSPQQLHELDSPLECSYFGCYISRTYGRYYFEFITATCTFNQVDRLASMTSFVLSPSVTEQKQVFTSTSSMTCKQEIHPTRKPSGPCCYSVDKTTQLA